MTKVKTKKINIQIRSWLNGSVLFEYESVDNTIAKTVEVAVERSANLRSANLSSADLRYANLRSADLRYANLRSANLRYATNLQKFYSTDLSLLLRQKNRLIAYKYLSKDMNSPIQASGKITYKVDKEYKVKVDSNRLLDCGKGLNIASLEWCLRQTNGNTKDYKYIEVSFDPKDLVVSYFSDGKFRVSKLKVERELTLEELKEACGVIK